ncbi:MAG TPA: hypothetical protein VGY77_01015 [Gemmataceae bacterium]|jgi:hypothetical protein|nr:hypothetical protein [Gemmataceae bacterium]
MKKILRVFGCGAVLVFVQNLYAQDELNPVKLPDGIKVVRIGDQPTGPPPPPIYNNTADTGHYFAPDPEAVPVEIADDVILPDPSVGTAHVNGFEFRYYQPDPPSFDCVVNFYGALVSSDPLAPDDRPDQTSAVASFTLTGLPGGGIFVIDVDLAGQGTDFDWPASTSSDGCFLNWMGFTFSVNGTGAGLTTATGGGSHDFIWSNKDLRPPYGTGDGNGFISSFGGTPEASFHIKIFGIVN